MKKLSLIVFIVVFSANCFANNSDDSTLIGNNNPVNNLVNPLPPITNPFPLQNFIPALACQPGPDGWLHTYGDKTGCQDDIHMRCTYSPLYKTTIVVQVVYGCFTRW